MQAKWDPLHTFALAGQIKFMDKLLEYEVDVEKVDKVRFLSGLKLYLSYKYFNFLV